MYEELLARATSTRRSRKPFEAANHPFVDRCAFVLDFVIHVRRKPEWAASQAVDGHRRNWPRRLWQRKISRREVGAST